MERLTGFKEKINISRHKLTEQRQQILNLLAEHSNRHLSAEEVHRLLADKGRKVGIATVYRTLALLEELELVHRVTLDDGCVRYQLAGSLEEHEHHHLICERCGEIVDVQDDLLDALEKELEVRYGFKITNHQVKFYGICKSCSAK